MSEKAYLIMGEGNRAAIEQRGEAIEVLGITFPSGRQFEMTWDNTFHKKWEDSANTAARQLDVMMKAEKSPGLSTFAVSVAAPPPTILVGLLLPAVQKVSPSRSARSSGRIIKYQAENPDTLAAGKSVESSMVIQGNGGGNFKGTKFEIKNCSIIGYKPKAMGGEISFSFTEVVSRPSSIRIRLARYS